MKFNYFNALQSLCRQVINAQFSSLWLSYGKLLFALPKLLRCHACMLFKVTAEKRSVAEMKHPRHLLYRNIALVQEKFDLKNYVVVYYCLWRVVSHGLCYGVKVLRSDAEVFGVVAYIVRQAEITLKQFHEPVEKLVHTL